MYTVTKLERIRPFVGGFLADGGTIDEDGLLAFIEVQETLTRNFGKKRSTVSIGIYDGANLVFPIRYKAVGRDSMRFEPLAPAGEGAEGWESREMTPGEILEQHPTGREYAAILEGLDEVPMLTDAEGNGDKSLMMLSWDNPLRRFCARVMLHDAFELVILILILLSTAVLFADVQGRGS